MPPPPSLSVPPPSPPPPPRSHEVGATLAAQGQTAEAEALLAEALAARRARHGAAHVDTRAACCALAALYERFDPPRPADSVPLYEAELECRRASLGARHASTLGDDGALHGLRGRGVGYSLSRRVVKAVAQALTMRRGVPHPQARSRSSAARCGARGSWSARSSRTARRTRGSPRRSATRTRAPRRWRRCAAICTSRRATHRRRTLLLDRSPCISSYRRASLCIGRISSCFVVGQRGGGLIDASFFR